MLSLMYMFKKLPVSSLERPYVILHDTKKFTLQVLQMKVPELHNSRDGVFSNSSHIYLV